MAIFRLLYVIDSLVPAGAERSLASIVPHLVARDVAVDVAYLEDRPGLHEELKSGGASLFCLSGRGGRVGAIRRTYGLICRRTPHVIHTTLFEADLAGRIAGLLSGVPVVTSLVGLRYGEEHLGDPQLSRAKVRAAQLIDAASAQIAVRFHAISRHVADAMAPRLALPRERIDVIPRGRDPRRLGQRTNERATNARTKLLIDSTTPLVLAVARQERVKGLDRLIEAFPFVLGAFANARLLIAGREGRATPQLLALTSRLGLQNAVRFVGERSDVPELLCAADVLILPSRREGLATLLLEAMALEAPIVASDLPAVREILLGDAMARLVSIDQPESLAAPIIDVLRNPAKARDRAIRARTQFLQRYTVGGITEEMLAFYERALSTPGRLRTWHLDRESLRPMWSNKQRESGRRTGSHGP